MVYLRILKAAVVSGTVAAAACGYTIPVGQQPLVWAIACGAAALTIGLIVYAGIKAVNDL